MTQPIGANEADVWRRESTAKVMAPGVAKGAWASSPRGNSRSRMLRSRTIPLHVKRHVPEEPFGACHTAEIQPVNVHHLSHMILSPEKILATSMGVGSLNTGRLRSRLRRHRALERQRVRDSRIESNEGLCTDTEWEAIRYVR